MIVENATRGTCLAENLIEATNPWTRLRGLLGRTGLNPGEGLLIRPCQGIHTWFMRFPIDVLYVDRQGTVCRLLAALAPNHHGPVIWSAAYVIELAAGAAAATGTCEGDQLELRAAPPAAARADVVANRKQG